jgi:NAD(P)H dehydrogenase (quinone)
LGDPLAAPALIQINSARPTLQRMRRTPGGDTRDTLTDLAAELARQSGKPVAYQDMPQEAFATALPSIGLPAGLAELLADADTGVSKGGLFDDSHQLSQLIGRPTTPLAERVKQALAA